MDYNMEAAKQKIEPTIVTSNIGRGGRDGRFVGTPRDGTKLWITKEKI